MMKTFLMLMVSTLFISARFTTTPVMECEAYNNMKHTKNSHHVQLHTDQEYTVLKKHKGQYLVLIKGESIAQRWVDGSCFSTKKKSFKKSKKPKHTKKYQKPIFINKEAKKQSLLVLSWHNAFCETHRKKTECRNPKKSEKGKLVLHGLWPQPRNNVYCDVPQKLIAKDKHHQWKSLPNIDIEESTLALMDSYMPGYVSRLHKHEWIKHGTCYGGSADRYYHDALTLASEVDHSAVGKLLRSHVGKKVTLGQIRSAFDHAFGAGAGQRVALKCQGGLITELWIHIGDKGDKLADLIAKGSSTKSRCHKGKVDRTGY
jgi:ribonuclease T2